MQYVLQAIGAFNPKEIDGIALSLYERYHYDVPGFRIELMAFGKRVSDRFSDPTKPLIQLEFHSLCRFIFRRFRQFEDIKNDHQHWDYAGRKLWNLAREHRNSEEVFIRDALSAFGIGGFSRPM